MNLSSIAFDFYKSFSYLFKSNTNTQNNNNTENNHQPENNTNRVVVEETSGSSGSLLKKSEERTLFKNELNKCLKEYSIQKTSLIGSMGLSGYSKDMDNNMAIDKILFLSPEETEILEDTNMLEIIHLNKDEDHILKLKLNFLETMQSINSLERTLKKAKAMNSLKIEQHIINHLRNRELRISEILEREEFSLCVLMILLKLDLKKSLDNHIENIQNEIKPEFRFNLIKSSIQPQLNQLSSWDPQFLLALNLEIQKFLPQLILDLQDSIKFCIRLENLIEKLKAQINIQYVPEANTAIFAFCENTPFSLTIIKRLGLNEKWKDHKQTVKAGIYESIFTSKRYLKEKLQLYKKNYENLLRLFREIHPCALNAYMIVQDCLFLYQIFTSTAMKDDIRENQFSGEFQCFVNNVKGTCINIIKTFLPFAREAQKFFGNEFFGEENESHIKEILNAQENPYASYEEELRKKLEEQWNDAEKEQKEIVQEKEKKKVSTQSKTSQQRSDDEKESQQANSTKIENNTNQLIDFSVKSEISRKEGKEQRRKELEERKQEAQKEKEENLKKLKEKNDSKLPGITFEPTNSMKVTPVSQPKKIYQIPSREDLDKKVIDKLNNNNQNCFESLFGFNDSAITHYDVLKLADAIGEALEKQGYAECAKNFLEDVKKHIHPNHGTSEGKDMSLKHKYCIRTYFILSGIIPLKWEPSLDNLQAFMYYEQKMKLLGEMKKLDK